MHRCTIFLKLNERHNEKRMIYVRRNREYIERNRVWQNREDKGENMLKGRRLRSSLCAMKLLAAFSPMSQIFAVRSVSRARAFIQTDGRNAKLKRHSEADPQQSNSFSSLHSGQSIVCSYCRTNDEIVKDWHDRFDLIGIKWESRMKLSPAFHSLSHIAFRTSPGFIYTSQWECYLTNWININLSY